MQVDVYPDYLLQDRATPPDPPGASWAGAGDWYTEMLLASRESRGSIVVNTQTALTYGIVWRCVNYIASTISSLCWHVYERSADGRSRKPIEDNIAWTLELQANPEMAAFEWRQVMLRDALLWGNGISEIERNGAGKPLWFWRIDPARIHIERDEAGRLVYRIRGPEGGPGNTLDPSNVFHLRGMSPDGIVGYSPIALHRRAIELGLSQQGYGVSFFRRGPMPGGFLKAPGAMKREDREAMSKSFSSNYGGAENAGRVPTLSGGMEFVPFVMPNKDAQWIEGQNLQGEDLCRIYGVPPHKAGIMAHSTNNNIEHQAIEAVQDCLLPWCRRLETEADIKLFGSVSRGKVRTRLDLQTLLRGDSATQTANLASQVNNGLRTPNEGREELDLNPRDDGDTLLVQGAMVPLGRALNPPAPPAAPGVPGAMPMEPAEPTEMLEMPMMMQSGSYDCGACCAHMVAEFFGVGNDRTEQDYIAELGTTTTDGTEPEAIVDLLNDAGLVTTSGSGMTLDNLREFFMDGKPVICPIQSPDDPAGGSSGGHYVVVVGCGLGMVFFNDPATGLCAMMDEDEFDARWHDIEADGVTSDHFGIAISDSFEDEEDEPEAVKTEPTAPAAPDEYVMPDNLRQPFATLLTDAYSRLLRIEADKAKREDSKGRLKEWAKEYYGNGSQSHVAASVRPVVDAFLVAAGKKADASGLSVRLAAEHVAASVSGIRDDGVEAVTGVNGRAAAQASRHLDLIWEAIR